MRETRKFFDQNIRNLFLIQYNRTKHVKHQRRAHETEEINTAAGSCVYNSRCRFIGRFTQNPEYRTVYIAIKINI